jgi:hypothetical protein
MVVGEELDHQLPARERGSSLGWDHAAAARFDTVRAAVSLWFRAHMCGLVPASDVF